MKKRILLSLIILLVTASSTPAAIIIEVPSVPYTTIQEGIDAAGSGDTVLIHPGTYTGDGNRDIDFGGKSITVRSIDPNDPCFVAATIIDCNGTEAEPHRGFNFSNNQDCNAVIDGLTIINGCAWDGGGAIDCRNNQASTLVISNCNINNNKVVSGRGSSGGGISVIDGIYLINNCMISNNLTERGGGGGISCEDSTLTISNSIISENINGGIRCEGSILTVHNCKIHGNSQTGIVYSGTGIGCGDSDVTITNSTISDNSSAGIGCYDSNTTILNCSISGNTGRGGGGIHCTRGSSIISNCKISGNTAPDFISENGGYGGGIHCDQGSSIINNCKISGNAGGEGGGIHCTRGSSIISNCKISGNTARYFTPMGYGGYGGGIYCDGSSSTINNCTFTGNSSAAIGGGMYNEDSSPTLTDCMFSQNLAHFAGGGMCNKNSNPTLTNCTFSGNESLALSGGGMYNLNSSPTLTNCTFSQNLVRLAGGGMCNEDSSPTLTGCTFSDNESPYFDGGGMFNNGSNPTLTNCTFSQNSAYYNGGGIYNYNGSNSILINCILWGDTPDEIYGGVPIVTYSDVEGGWPGLGNIDVDPCFVDPCSGNYHLLPASPCIDAGDNTAVPAGVTTDLDGNPRFIDQPEVPDTGNGTAPIVDMGAYEANYTEVPMKFTPQALNLTSGGRLVKAHFTLPEEFAVEDVDANTPAVIAQFGVESYDIKVLLNDEGLVRVEATFRRSDLCSSITSYDDNIEVIVTGRLTTGRYFYGTDIIKITDRAFEYLALFVSYWLQGDCIEPDWCGGADLNADSVVNFLDFALLDRCCIEVIEE